MSSSTSFSASDRWAIYWLLIVCSAATMTGRLWRVEKDSYDLRVPFLSANDRSRWCTIRALGDHDTYAIDEVLQSEGGYAWDTIDKVLHWGSDFRPHFYSSKPPLLPTLLTYPYLGLRSLTGWTLADDPFPVVRWLLLFCHIAPLVIAFIAIGRTLERIPASNWARIFVMILATFGTYLTTFAISLNNHVPAFVCVALGLMWLVPIWRNEPVRLASFVLAGLACGLAAAFELPALAFCAFGMAVCLWRNPRAALLGYLPAVGLVAAAFFATNHLAHGTWRPAYAFRSDGPVLAELEGDFADPLDAGQLPTPIAEAYPVPAAVAFPKDSDAIVVMRGGWPETDPRTQRRWLVWPGPAIEAFVVAEVTGSVDGTDDRDGPNRFELRRRDNWYEYPGSYWLSDNAGKSRVDRGEPDAMRYLLHLTVGHHGVFSLTPVWLLILPGLLGLALSRRYGLRFWGLSILAISVVVFAFYVTRPAMDRNYGGMCCAPRWFFWLAPLWMLGLVPVLDWVRQRPAVCLLFLLVLAASIASAASGWTNPWTEPWTLEWLESAPSAR